MNREIILSMISHFIKNKNVSETKCIEFVDCFLDKLDAVLMHKKKTNLSQQEILFIYHTFFTSPTLNIDSKINIQDFL